MRIVTVLLLLLIGCSAAVPTNLSTPYKVLEIKQIESSRSSVVKVIRVVNTKDNWSGTGVIINKTPTYTYVLTANHIIRDMPSTEVVYVVPHKKTLDTLDDFTKFTRCTVVAASKELDIAVLRCSVVLDGEAVELSDVVPGVGNEVYLISHPMNARLNVVFGHINHFMLTGRLNIVTTCKALPGSSGGGLFYCGKCVGILLSYDQTNPDNSNSVSAVDIIRWLDGIGIRHH